MDFFKNIFAKKWAFFRFYGGKKIFCGECARSRGVGVRGLLRGAALECCEARVDGRSWARAFLEACVRGWAFLACVPSRDGGCRRLKYA